jgi:hypothetical protein
MNEEKKAFLAVGAGAYAPGLGALARFRQEIYSGSKRSMTRNLGRLSTTTGLDLRADKIEPYAFPDSLVFTTLAAKLTVQGRTHIYASMMWRQATDDETPVVVAVEFEPWYAPWKRKILRVARELWWCSGRREPGDLASGRGVAWEYLGIRALARWRFRALDWNL